MSGQVLVVRHGRTAHNAGGRLLGRLDPPLDDEGERQAAALARALGPVATVVASPLLRTRATAEVVAAAGGATVELDERWLELDYGELDGVRLADVPAATWAAWRADPTFRPPGGESLADLGARVRPACEDVLERARGGDVVVVTHVSPIKAALCWALGVGDEVSWRAYVAPASITRIGRGPAGPSLRGFNDVAHLADPAG